MCADPIMQNFIPAVCGDGAFSDFNQNKTQDLLRQSLEKINVVQQPKEESKKEKKRESNPGFTLKRRSHTPQAVVVDEIKRFFEQPEHPLLTRFCPPSENPGEPAAITFEAFCDLLRHYNPLVFWSRPNTHRDQFPRFFKLNTLTLAYMSSNAYLETVFSKAQHVVDLRRSRLSNKLMEATIMMNVFLTMEVAKLDTETDHEESDLESE